MQLQGGFETQIYRFRLKGVKGELSGDLVLRLYPAFYGAVNAEWESVVQRVLAKTGYPVAKVHTLCTDLAILGGAFFIMDYLPGKPLMFAPMDTIAGLLGKTHAALHCIDPRPLVKSLGEHGINETLLTLENRYEWIQKKREELPWLNEVVGWLVENRPRNPERLAICHGDFHPLNILVQDGEVTGVLDWPGLLIADPVLDVANTVILSTIPFKHLAPTLGMDVSSVDFDEFLEGYLNAYKGGITFDPSNLSYFRVRRCVHALIQGNEGQVTWGTKPIVDELIAYIHSVSSVKVVVPEYSM